MNLRTNNTLINDPSQVKEGPSPLKELKLVKEVVDEEYKRELTPKGKIFWNWLKASVHPMKGDVILLDKVNGVEIGRLNLIPISVKEIYRKHNEQFGSVRPTVIMWTRMLWKAGLIYRFYEGDWVGHKVYKGTEKEVQGKRWGVRYLW